MPDLRICLLHCATRFAARCPEKHEKRSGIIASPIEDITKRPKKTASLLGLSAYCTTCCSNPSNPSTGLTCNHLTCIIAGVAWITQFRRRYSRTTCSPEICAAAAISNFIKHAPSSRHSVGVHRKTGWRARYSNCVRREIMYTKDKKLVGPIKIR